jgi:hypothetical protein
LIRRGSFPVKGPKVAASLLAFAAMFTGVATNPDTTDGKKKRETATQQLIALTLSNVIVAFMLL